MQKSNVVEMPTEPPQMDLNTVAPSGAALILAGDSMDRMMRLATVMATGRSTIPKHLQGSTGDCMAVIMQAMSWRMNPFAVAQKTHIVNGALGFEAQLINAAIIGSGLLAARPSYEWYGDWSKVIGNYREVESKKNPGETYRKLASTAADEKGCGCKVSATLNGEASPRVLDLLLTQAGVRNSPLWADDPRQQLAYLAIKRWARLYTPDVILGVYSPDELESIQPGERDMGAATEVNGADKVKSALGHGAAKAQAKPGPTLNNVLLQIQRAETAEDMTAAAAECARLTGDDDKAIARKGYSERLAALKRAASEAKDLAEAKANGIDIGTGEIIDQAAAPAPTYAAILDGINKAATLEDLDLTRSQIKGVADEAQKAELNAAASARLKAIKAAAKGE